MEGSVGSDSTFIVENDNALCEGECGGSGNETLCSVICGAFGEPTCQTAVFRRQ